MITLLEEISKLALVQNLGVKELFIKKMTEPIFWKNFEARTDLKQFGNNALLLYAFDLKFDIEDVDSFASENIVENNDDKKCDLIYIDYEMKAAIVTQSYFSLKIKKEAKANKAADLNTAAGWLLSSDITKVQIQ